MLLARLYRNHPLANLVYVLVLVLGVFSYFELPRERLPDVSHNFVDVYLTLPGASAEDVEKLVVAPIEQILRTKVSDIRRVTSNSQVEHGTISVEFQEIDRPTYNTRMHELKREVQLVHANELPRQTEQPFFYEYTGSNASTIPLILYGPGDDTHMREQAHQIKRDLQRLSGVERVELWGLEDPELQVVFDPHQLAAAGITPSTLADTSAVYFRDLAAGTLTMSQRRWLVRLANSERVLEQFAQIPLEGAHTPTTLGDVATVSRGWKKSTAAARYQGKPAFLFWINKRPNANLLKWLSNINTYLDTRNKLSAATGIACKMMVDPSVETRSALSLMTSHAWSGLVLVFVVTLIILGSRLAGLITLAAPFSLAGTFIILHAVGSTLNLSVLLGVMIALGMLVDDAVVVGEAVHQRLRTGVQGLTATLTAIREVWLPVSGSSFTTMAAFVPLLLLGGVLGASLKVVPAVVCVALLISLVQALWLLPAHLLAYCSPQPGTRWDWRRMALQSLQRRYLRIVANVLRHPWRALAVLTAVFVLAGSALYWEWVRFEYFGRGPIERFDISIEMPAGTALNDTLQSSMQIEQEARRQLPTEVVSSTIATAGWMFNGVNERSGSHYGQILVALDRNKPFDIAAAGPKLEQALSSVPGPLRTSVVAFGRGIAGKAIAIKIRGDDSRELQAASNELQTILRSMPEVSGILADEAHGLAELTLSLKGRGIEAAGINPDTVRRSVALLVDGEVVTSLREAGEKLGVRVVAKPLPPDDIDALLRLPLAKPQGPPVPLGEVVEAVKRESPVNIPHYNFQRVLTLEADLDTAKLDTLAANKLIQQQWDPLRSAHPNVTVEFTGEVEEIESSLQGLQRLLVLGLGLIFIILGAQYASYRQAGLILIKVPMAFAGVIIGLLITREPASLNTLYGGVALAGITINSAVLFFSAASDRLTLGMALVPAVVYAARRRLLPIVITALTTIAGLLPLAIGFGGESLTWRPVATAIVWGMVFSTLMTLFMVPLLYWIAMSFWPATAKA